jgi:hypothetical protein
MYRKYYNDKQQHREEDIYKTKRKEAHGHREYNNKEKKKRYHACL